MSEHIYILTDGVNSKIGITTSLDKRISAYNTHNPNFYTYKTHECSIEQAKKIEAVIKLYFKEQLTGSGKEWFGVEPQEISKIVTFFLEPSREEVITPAMHGVKLPKEIYELKQKICVALAKQNKQKRFNPDESYDLKNQTAELFARSFKLGIPEHRLPQDIVMKDGLGPDFYHWDKNSEAVEKAVKSNRIRLPYDDHTANFYHMVKLFSGSYVAVCTSRVSMPYLKAVEGKMSDIWEMASSLGLYAFKYDDWSWYSPDESGLILFTHKTPVHKRLSLWENSFRKWVIERQKLLEQEKMGNKEEQQTYIDTIETICFDTTFPPHIQSVEEFYDDYFEPFWGYSYNDEHQHFMQSSYELLFKKWKSK